MQLKIVLFFLVTVICTKVNNCQSNESVRQGIRGKVMWLEGNMMPGPGVTLQKGKPVEREIYIHKPTTGAQVKGEGSLFTEVNSELVTKVKSNEDGYFEAVLKPGKYSLFIKEGDKFFASRMDEQHYCPVFVEKDSVSQIEIKINYKAYY